MFLNIWIDWIILKTYDQQFTLTKSLHIIFKVGSVPCSEHVRWLIFISCFIQSGTTWWKTTSHLSLTENKQELIRRWYSKCELFYDNIVHVQASAYARWTDFLISTINIYARPNLCTQSSMHLRPSNRVISLFCPKNRWIIAQIVLICSWTIKSRIWNRGRPNNCFTTTSYTKIPWNNAK